MTADDPGLLERGLTLIGAAEEVDVPLRMTGSLACVQHCPAHREQHLAMRGEAPHDLDLVSERKTYRPVRQLLEEHGYLCDEQVALASDRRQLLFRHPEHGFDVDVYLGELNYCHPISFAGRLRADSPTAPLAELLLAKLQIVEMTGKDIADSSMLILEHDFADDDRDAINLKRIAEVLSDDWGFHHTTGLSLAKVEHGAQASEDCSAADRETIAARIGHLQETLESAPKSRRWRMRSRIGTRKRWYQDVEEKTLDGGGA